MKRTILFIFFVSFMVSACDSQQEPPENLISEDTYVSLLIEMQLLEAYSTINTDSTTIDSLLKQVLKKYSVTEKQFTKSHRYYQNNIGKQTERIDRAIERLRKDRIRQPDSAAVDSISSNNPNQKANNE